MLPQDRYGEVLAREFDYVTPENATKWGALQTKFDVWNFDAVDQIVQAAGQAEQHVKGHTLVWHNQLPAWLSEDMDPGEFESAVRAHISVTVSRYAGTISAWDVVNEALTVGQCVSRLLAELRAAG